MRGQFFDLSQISQFSITAVTTKVAEGALPRLNK
jgi:hypothetical protein